ncbi:MAG: hypothetical protein EBU98_04280 [Actinobacteria bacterium]|nr:hypothetical protein [Actinomycetota bacterium]
MCDVAKISRATLYRAFPGGKEVLLEALRVRELELFFTTLRAHAEGETTLEDTIVRCMVVATTELRNDQHLALMLAAEPGDVLAQLTVAGVPRLALLDSAALGLAFGEWIGRLGCIAVGEHLGGPTSFFLGWTYLGGTTRELGYAVGQTYHNTAIYEFLWLMPLIGLMLWLDRRRVAPGQLLGTFMVGYAACRFGTDFLRINDKTALGLTGAQYMCALVLPFGIWLLVRKRRNQAELTAVSPQND